jgi:hypothetical protein
VSGRRTTLGPWPSCQRRDRQEPIAVHRLSWTRNSERPRLTKRLATAPVPHT